MYLLLCIEIAVRVSETKICLHAYTNVCACMCGFVGFGFYLKWNLAY